MNLTVEPTELPAPQLPAPTPPPSRRRRNWLIAGAAALAIGWWVIVAVAVSFVVDDDDDITATAAADLTPDTVAESVADLDVNDSDDSASTGNADVDIQIVEAVWEGRDGKVAMCPAFRDVKRRLPSLSDEEVVDMGFALADLSDMTPVQIERLRELVLSEC